MIIVAIGIAMVLPMFVPEDMQETYLVFLAVMFVFMFLIFTRIQIKEHSYFFQYDYKAGSKEDLKTHSHIKGLYHVGFLAATIILIGFLSELMSVFMHESLRSSGLPLTLGALAVAVISASPELLTAIKSAAANRMQTVINIALGASLSTVLLTIPAMIVLALLTHHEINFVLSPVQLVLLLITFLASIVHFCRRPVQCARRCYPLYYFHCIYFLHLYRTDKLAFMFHEHFAPCSITYGIFSVNYDIVFTLCSLSAGQTVG